MLEPARVDLAALVREVSAQFERQAIAGGVELVVDAPGPVFGRWDRVRLKQIVSNLISNAIRYGGDGKVEIMLTASEHRVELSVRDHGLGISPQELATIFDRFEHRPAQRASGFGIGLFVVKTLCRAMGGDAQADNAVGGGARFTVVLSR
jgi:signal transduction histidine kinase